VGCPDLPGCWSQGKTEEEALENIKSAIVDYLAAVDEMNQRKQTRYVEVIAS
jgi:predicted RNase H-like HicB family nuclease